MEEEKIKALAEFLGCDPSEITDNGDNEFEYSGGGTYKVFTDEEADEEFDSYERSLWDDMGLDSFSEWFRNWIIENAVDKDYFWDNMHESNRNYAYSISDEDDDQYGNRLVQECYDNDLITDDDFEKGPDGEPDYENCIYDTDELADKLTECMDSDNDSSVAWIIDNFGWEELSTLVKENPNCIDIELVIEELKDVDGRGGALARWDGVENEQNGYYIYKQDE